MQPKLQPKKNKTYVLQKERRCYSYLQIFFGHVWSKFQNIGQMDRRRFFIFYEFSNFCRNNRSNAGP